MVVESALLPATFGSPDALADLFESAAPATDIFYAASLLEGIADSPEVNEEALSLVLREYQWAKTFGHEQKIEGLGKTIAHLIRTSPPLRRLLVQIKTEPLPKRTTLFIPNSVMRQNVERMLHTDGTISQESFHLSAVASSSIATAGLGMPSSTLGEFSSYRTLNPQERGWLLRLWRAYEELVGPSYRDMDSQSLEDPLSLSRDALELIDDLPSLPADVAERLLHFHIQLRQSLAMEKKLSVSMGQTGLGIPVEVRYIVSDDLSFPLRDGTIRISPKRTEEGLERFEAAIGSLGTKRREAYRDQFIKLDAVYQRYLLGGAKAKLKRQAFVKRLFPGLQGQEARRLVILHAVITYLRRSENGDKVVENLPNPASFWDFVVASSKALGLRPHVIASELGVQWSAANKPCQVRLLRLPSIILLMNLLGVKRPWPLLEKIYGNELRWAFKIRQEGDETVFYTTQPLDLGQLKAQGMGPLLNQYRIERGWSWEEFARRTSAELARKGKPSVGPHVLQCYGTNTFQPEFFLMEAMVVALNRKRRFAPINPAEIFLAAHPSFIHFLPIGFTNHEGLVAHPNRGPFQLVNLPVRQGQKSQIKMPKDNASRLLDPQGLPFSVRRVRLRLNLNSKQFAARLGVGYSFYLRSLEHDPKAGGKKKIVPSRVTLSILVGLKAGSLSVEEILRRHIFSYWNDDPVVTALRRTFKEPTFISATGRRQLLRYIRSPFPLPGEILFYWRNSAGPLIHSATFSFPPDIPAMAKFLGVGTSSYNDLERGRQIPSEEEARRIAALHRRTPQETEAFLKACRRARQATFFGGNR